jgi:hypothetical protein
MNSMDQKFLLLWKGTQSGPFSLEEIRARLAAGEISRVHQLQVDGRWQLLDDYLEKQRERPLTREAQLVSMETRSSLAHLLPREHEPAVMLETRRVEAPAAESSAPVRTSGLAIAALVMALCNFIPYVNFLSWILALVFGHIALVQMNRDERLGGRGMAMTGLIITYFLLVMVLTFGILMLYHGMGKT